MDLYARPDPIRRSTMTRLATALLLLNLVAGCGGITEQDQELPPIPGPMEITLGFGERHVIVGTVIEVHFEDVPEDSRCPSDAVCVWAGNAVVALTVSNSDEIPVDISLNTNLEPGSARWDGIVLTLLSLAPEPLAEIPIDPEDYVATILLEPAN
jgi:hypothetical protein